MDDFIAFGKPSFGEGEIAAVTRVMQSGWVGMGPETVAFEQELAAFLGCPEVVTVNSCTAALTLSLRVLGIGPGDEVVCPSLTWCSTANAALYLGAVPVFADVSEDTLCLDPEDVLRAVTPRTRAVIVVHFGGLAADVGALSAMLPRGCALIEDAAHAMCARYPDGDPVGSSGNLCCFSFYANKTLSTGEGGAIALADPAQAGRLRSLRQHALESDAWQRYSTGRGRISDLRELGYKANYTDLQAAIGRVQLTRQEEFAARRLEVARYYARELDDLGLTFQRGCTDSRHARHLFAVRLPETCRRPRDDIVRDMREAGIGVSVHYPALHPMPLYAQSPRRRLPVTDSVAPRLLTLPIGPLVGIPEAARVVATLRRVLAA